MASADEDGSGQITYRAFVDVMTAKMGEKDGREEMQKAFRLFDAGEKGAISFQDLKRVARELGESMTEEELQEMIGTWKMGLLVVGLGQVTPRGAREVQSSRLQGTHP